jgi:hypothetical protein
VALLAVFCGLLVSVLAIVPKVYEFKPGRGRWILKGNKIRSMLSCGGEVKPSAPYRNVLRHFKETLEE